MKSGPRWNLSGEDEASHLSLLSTTPQSYPVIQTHSDVRSCVLSAPVPSLSMSRWIPTTLLWILKIWIDTESLTFVKSGSSGSRCQLATRSRKGFLAHLQGDRGGARPARARGR